MTSEEDHRSRLNIIIVRIRTFIHTNTKLAALISFVLGVLIPYFVNHILIPTSTSPYASKRYGLGAGDTTGELQAALRRKGDGRAAVAIIRVIGMDGGNDSKQNSNVQYLVQLKSHDYPIEAFHCWGGMPVLEIKHHWTR